VKILVADLKLNAANVRILLSLITLLLIYQFSKKLKEIQDAANAITMD